MQLEPIMFAIAIAGLAYKMRHVIARMLASSAAPPPMEPAPLATVPLTPAPTAAAPQPADIRLSIPQLLELARTEEEFGILFPMTLPTPLRDQFRKHFITRKDCVRPAFQPDTAKAP